ncbi:MAG: ATP-dependent DNA helicase RecG, partial [Clostridia bacterium]|nr:ATP-dependent DNA helicase RecG [Clostridia bacterium]
LVSDAKGERARDRLGTIKRCRNGYDIAEEDLKQRGPGDLFGENGAVRQHGKSSLVLASTCTDTELLGMATSMAAEVLKRDPALALPENQGILSAAHRFLDNTENIMN